ncbi:hypothetical protein DNTS_003497 [Danionella cerebrum]|uniref:Uncharacterized protein n=1 Tax=Danionella cerebrum TaxID=2873325 RepID=A0A553MLF3_9TELE|nr:hypothetical protein DNTS_003497 [Danionella translucida]TRY54014.1 hypothetical protein DNTS_003497 [Danionella translucida]
MFSLSLCYLRGVWRELAADWLRDPESEAAFVLHTLHLELLRRQTRVKSPQVQSGWWSSSIWLIRLSSDESVQINQSRRGYECACDLREGRSSHLSPVYKEMRGVAEQKNSDEELLNPLLSFTAGSCA